MMKPYPIRPKENLKRWLSIHNVNTMRSPFVLDRNLGRALMHDLRDVKPYLLDSARMWT